MRNAEIKRKTGETDITLFLELDGKGDAEIDTGSGFFNHMLELFAAHARFDLKIKCKGDLEVDCHHTVEDTAIALGNAFLNAIGDKRGITRYGSVILPMDETLMLCSVDISGRSYLNYNVAVCVPKVGEFDTQLGEEFMAAFVRNAGVTLHFEQLEGINAHHILEAVFKSFGRTLRAAVKIDPEAEFQIPSTKGIL